MFKKYSVCLLTGLGIFSGALYADAPGSNAPGMEQNSMSPLVPGNPIKDDQLSPGIFPSAMYKFNQNHDCYVSGDFIYWATTRPFNEIIPVQSVSGNTITFKQALQSTPYHPGFKLGMGMGLPGFDNVVVNMGWTRLHSTSATSVTPENGQTMAPSQFVLQNGPNCSKVKAVSRFHIDLFELTAGRPLYLSKRMLLNASFGLKGAYGNQNYRADYDILAGGTGTFITKGSYWLLGPYLNVGAKGLLGAGLYLLGKAGLLVPYFKELKSSVVTQFPQFATPNHSSRSEFGSVKPYMVQPFIEAGIGLGWNRYFANNNYHIDLSASYDLLATWVDSVSLASPPIKVFGLHGYTFKAQLDF